MRVILERIKLLETLQKKGVTWPAENHNGSIDIPIV
jgi:hypothetical protein